MATGSAGIGDAPREWCNFVFIAAFYCLLSSEISVGTFKAAFNSHLGILPGWFVKLMTLALIWAYLHHFAAGMRHLFMDMNHAAVTKDFGRKSAATVYVVSLSLTLVLGLKLFGVY